MYYDLCYIFLGMISICMLCFGFFSMSLWLSGGVLSHGGTPNHPIVMDDSGWPWLSIETTMVTSWESSHDFRTPPFSLGIIPKTWPGWSGHSSAEVSISVSSWTSAVHGPVAPFARWSWGVPRVSVDTMGSPGLKEIKMWIKGETLGNLV